MKYERNTARYFIDNMPQLFPDFIHKWARNDKTDSLSQQYLYLEDDGKYQRLFFEVNGEPSMPIGLLYYISKEGTHKFSRISVVFRRHER